MKMPLENGRANEKALLRKTETMVPRIQSADDASRKNMSLDHAIIWCENRYIWYELTSNFNKIFFHTKKS
jgi:hypothetical protein